MHFFSAWLSLGNPYGTGQYAEGTGNLGFVSSINNSWWLTVDLRNWMLFLVLMMTIATFTSLGTTFLLKRIQQAMYLS